LEDLEKIQEHGKDSVVFYISTNPGVPLKPLQEVASGGEMSRIMLAMKAVMAGQDEIDTLIFDEIDAGISGRTAQKVSEKMALIAAAHQVICITHLAQIAAMADSHFEIIKTASDQSTRTRVRPLNEEERIGELERILGGVSITKAVEENAREMKRQADAQKNQIRQNRTEEKR
ncbi:MAG: DNA repair protein RecN, partial [Lachnospiraceae bacterium]|nr:DNA repair protein RecN [Lachnospiraceae bacterium]